jgi:uncharacterized membrane protein YqjE
VTSDNNSTASISAIPLSPVDTGPGDPANQSIGMLVSEATSQVSALVRAEVELAKAELSSEVKKALTGSVFFIAALVILLFSLFFLFFTLAEALWDLGLPRWASFGIVFAVMLLGAGGLAFLGYRRFKRIKAPERTINSVKDTAAALKRSSND